MDQNKRDLSIIRNSRIKHEGDLDRICRCVDRNHFNWGNKYEGYYCPTGSAGLYWILRTLAESSIGITPDKTICDVGFGSGTVLATFAILGYKTYGIDFREQPLQHASEFFRRVQQDFGEFRHQPQLTKGEVKQGIKANFRFDDWEEIDNLDFYYAYVNNETNSTPTLMKSIIPKKGAIVIARGGYFHTPKQFEIIAEGTPHLYPDGPRDTPTFEGLGYTLVNKEKQIMKPYEEKGIGTLERAYHALFIKD